MFASVIVVYDCPFVNTEKIQKNAYLLWDRFCSWNQSEAVKKNTKKRIGEIFDVACFFFSSAGFVLLIASFLFVLDLKRKFSLCYCYCCFLSLFLSLFLSFDCFWGVCVRGGGGGVNLCFSSFSSGCCSCCFCFCCDSLSCFFVFLSSE